MTAPYDAEPHQLDQNRVWLVAEVLARCCTNRRFDVRCEPERHLYEAQLVVEALDAAR